MCTRQCKLPGLQALHTAPGNNCRCHLPTGHRLQNQAAVGLCLSPPSAVVSPPPAPSRPVLQCPAQRRTLSTQLVGGSCRTCVQQALGSWRGASVLALLVLVAAEPLVQGLSLSRPEVASVPSSAPSEGLLLPRLQPISLRKALDWLVCVTYSPQTRGP